MRSGDNPAASAMQAYADGKEILMRNSDGAENSLSTYLASSLPRRDRRAYQQTRDPGW